MTHPPLISMRCLVSEPQARYEWHTHPFDEFSLVTEDHTLIGYGAGLRPTKPNTLLLYRHGERHGAWCGLGQTPRFWVMQFDPDQALARQLPVLTEPDPTQRVWELPADAVETFKWFFLQILREQIQPGEESREAESAWLRLLLIWVQRWATGDLATNTQLDSANPDLARLYHLVEASAGQGATSKLSVNLDNYDSLRHGFKKAFGISPRDLIQRRRMQKAKNLLLESHLSIKEVSARVGYLRQHEFTRAFHKHAGMSPSEWRQNPLAVSLSPNGSPPSNRVALAEA